MIASPVAHYLQSLAYATDATMDRSSRDDHALAKAVGARGSEAILVTLLNVVIA